MNSPARLADLSLNCVIRDSSPKLTLHSISHASWECSGTWLCTNTVATSGSRPTAKKIAASSIVRSPTTPGSLGDGQGVEVDDAVEHVLVVLPCHPVAQRPEVVAEVDVAGGLHAGQDSGHGANATESPSAARRVSRHCQVAHGEPVVRPLLVEDDVQRTRATFAVGRAAATTGPASGALGGCKSSASRRQEVTDQPLSLVRGRRARPRRRLRIGVDAHLGRVVHEVRRQAPGVERVAAPRTLVAEPRVDDEDEVTQRLDGRPLVVDPLLALFARAARGCVPIGRCPLLLEQRPAAAQARRDRRSAAAPARGGRRSSSASINGIDVDAVDDEALRRSRRARHRPARRRASARR